MTFFLEKLRKLFKSIGKLEFAIVDKLIFLKNSTNKFEISDNYFDDIESKILKKKFSPKKLVVVVCFFYNKKKIINLKKTINQISSYKFKKELIIITNNIDTQQRKKLKSVIDRRIKNFNIYEVKDAPDSNILPWYSINIMKNKYKNKTNTHFMFLEDDILVSNLNIFYWIYFRVILKKYKLVPGFLRYEKNGKKYFSVDNPQKMSLKKNPHIFSYNRKNGFINSKFPYNAMYFMDRELMKQYLKSNAIKFDFAFHNKAMNSIYPIKEQLNVAYAYDNVPKGFYNKLVLPFKNNKILDICFIKHSELKYSKINDLNKLGYGTIELKKLFD